mgnify:CR=1 FL=1
MRHDIGEHTVITQLVIVSDGAFARRHYHNLHEAIPSSKLRMRLHYNAYNAIEDYIAIVDYLDCKLRTGELIQLKHLEKHTRTDVSRPLAATSRHTSV